MGKKTVLTVLACGAIALATAFIIFVINNTEPTAQKGGATRKSAALVDVIQVVRAEHRPELLVLGIVEPARSITLSSRVDGEVLEVAAAFTPGGFVDAKAMLLQLDPLDYENNLALQESALREAEAALMIEEGRRTVAEKEFALLSEDIDAANRALVLREPQIASARARLAAAQADLDQAQLDLQRTEIQAPFDAQILERFVNLGSQVRAGEPLARLVGTEEYWIAATVPLKTLQWIDFPDSSGTPGSKARVRNRSAWPEGVFREAEVVNLIGAVDAQTRLARVLVTVKDPLARQTEQPPLLLDTVLEVRIQGKPLPDVVKLERSYLRGGDTVWVKEDGQLSIREVDVLFQDATHAFISGGLSGGERVVTTNLATVAEGIALREADEAGEGTAP